MLSGDGYLTRLMGTDLERETRMEVYAQTWQAVQAAPWTGYGAGSFEKTFPLSADARVSNWDKAHNDWLEAVFELGWPAALLWFAVLASLGLRCLVGFFRRHRDQVYPLVGFCACVLVGLHSMVDFSLQIPAVAVTFSALLGVGIAQSWSSRG
jgi:O-antigen ligase